MTTRRINEGYRVMMGGMLLACFMISLCMVTVPTLGQAVTMRPKDPDLTIHTALYDAIEMEASGDFSRSELKNVMRRRSVYLDDLGRVHVEIIGPEGGPAITASALTPYGAELENAWRNRADAWIPLPQVVNLARRLAPNYRLQKAMYGTPTSVMGEGPAETNSQSYRDGGADGAGLTIAIFDGGFDNLTEAMNNGDAPPPGQATRINLTSTDFEEPDDGTHGTGCVEAAYDHCPGATWRIYKYHTLVDLGNAVDDAIGYGVDIISHSIAWYNTGWEDDSGDACNEARNAAEAGIFFFTAAGNSATEHWQGFYNAGPDAPNVHDWIDGDEMLSVTVPDGQTVSFFLSWDHTNGQVYDYDLSLWGNGGSMLLDYSNFGGNTFEEVSYDNSTGSDRVVELRIERESGGSTEMEIFMKGSATWNEHIIAAGSTISPTNCTHPNVIVVGAVHHGLYDYPNGFNTIMSYSSQGPSNSGMTLPDICGPTHTIGFTYDDPIQGFGGTSCATPNCAGAMCAFWSADTQLLQRGVWWLTLRQADLWRDWGVDGEDNVYGWGGLFLTDYVEHTIWVARSYENYADDRGYPFYTVQAAHDAQVPGGRLLFFPGGTYPEPATLSTNMRLETIEHDATLGQ
ncbi:MAG: S8 family serine peptidase [Candidatus Eisenbacteria bacterium]|uniref:S8 family serine peptidase n=1 Tax=Eiseniibacteriota bacterium TaxID=2212470 RepID=A0A948W7G9_UNCEI|nr:S8 family serine peptidase [Candidatus Eisenbacteria bacterium]MBU1948116.1 S8 family serine peptidase [Candidatus Eisenbacteria bacterium]MBU2692589.1 S8 family serine peptidase [Candidatus Eisenbacteria bacterium]